MVDYPTISILFAGMSIAASILYYASVLRNTNRTRQGQLIMQVYNKFSDPNMATAWQKFYEKREHIQTTEDLLNEWFTHPENFQYRYLLGTFFEGVGVLVKENLLNIRLVAELMTTPIMDYWEFFAPYIDEARARHKMFRMMSETEYLYNELMEYMDKHPELKP